MAPGLAAASSLANRSRFTSRVSGPHSCARSAPRTASSSVVTMVMRAAAFAASRARPCAAWTFSAARIRAGAALRAAGSGSVSRTSQPLRANTMAHERPIRPAPMTAAIGMAILLTAKAPCGADRDLRTALSRRPDTPLRRAPAQQCGLTARAPDQDGDRR